MTSKVFSLLILTLLLATCKSPDRPNLLLVIVDDLGLHDLSHYGSRIYQTPNLDRLAAESLVFERAYANYPRCVPSRYALFTGSYPVLAGGEVPDDGFNIDKPSVVKDLREAGYRTELFGKWHLGDHPENAGFDHIYGGGEAGSPRSFLYPFNEAKRGDPHRKEPIPDVDENAREGDYLTDVLTDAFLENLENVSKSRPFLSVLSYYAVHQPLEAKTADEQRNTTEITAHDFGQGPKYIREGSGRTKMWQDNPAYAAMVENVDAQIGRVLAKLEAEGLAENTIVVVTSDHGGLSNDGLKQRQLATSNAPLRAGKGWLYEGGIRVPLFVRWPDKIAPGRNENSIVMLMDILPTFLAYAGEEAGPRVQGKNLTEVIMNRENLAERTVFWHAPNARPKNTGDYPTSAVLSGEWKLIDFFGEGRQELYHLPSDPGERNNLVGAEEERVNSMLKELELWRAEY